MEYRHIEASPFYVVVHKQEQKLFSQPSHVTTTSKNWVTVLDVPLMTVLPVSQIVIIIKFQLLLFHI